MAAKQLFRRHFNIDRNVAVPSARAINIWVRNFEATGSVLQQKPPDKHRTNCMYGYNKP